MAEHRIRCPCGDLLALKFIENGHDRKERLSHRRARVNRLAEHSQLRACAMKLLGDGAGVIDIPGGRDSEYPTRTPFALRGAAMVACRPGRLSPRAPEQSLSECSLKTR
jgi:hypothetical protein